MNNFRSRKKIVLMKKKAIAVFITFSLLFSFAFAVHADTFNNGMFIGTWKSSEATDTNYAVLGIDYCDSSTVICHFYSVKDGAQPLTYAVYQGTVSNTSAKCSFDVFDQSGLQTDSGTMEFDMFVDNIWLSMYSDSGAEIYNGMMKNDISGFNPYASPFSENVKVSVNGQAISFAVNPFVVNGTTYVPLRSVFDSMNINVFWDDYNANGIHKQTITAVRNEKIIRLGRSNSGKGFLTWNMLGFNSADTYSPQYDNIDILPHQPIILNSTTYVPLRVISESFGADVSWDPTTSTAVITDDISSDTKKNADEIKKLESFSLSDAERTLWLSFGEYTKEYDPYYTYKTKYYVFDCSRDGTNIVACVDNEGNTREYTADEWQSKWYGN